MSTSPKTLQIALKTPLPKDTTFFMADDSKTLFYHFEPYGGQHRLYAHWEGQEVDAELVGRCIFSVGVNKNVIYFDLDSKIYKAFLTSKGIIDVCHVRNKLSSEQLRLKSNGTVGLCVRLLDGKAYAYRMCDDPIRDAILVGISEDEIKGRNLKVQAIHRGRVIYTQETRKLDHLAIQSSNDRLIVIEMEYHGTSVFADDSSPFVYVAAIGTKILTLDTRTMKFLEPLTIEDFSSKTLIKYIATIRNGVMAMCIDHNDDNFSVIVQLPIGYYEPTDPVDNLQSTMQRKPDSSSTFSSDSVSKSVLLNSGISNEIIEVGSALDEVQGNLPKMKKMIEEFNMRASSTFSSNSQVSKRDERDASAKMGSTGEACNSSSTNSSRTQGDQSSKQHSKVMDRLSQGGLMNKRPSNVDTSGENQHFDSEFSKKFQPLSILGIGGFGCVFEAKNLMDKWKYAVKRIPMRGSSQSVNEALDEVCTLASLRHEGIVGYNCSWIEKPPPGWQKRSDAGLLRSMGINGSFNLSDDCVFIYIQMELCKQTLSDWLDDNKTRDIAQVKLWFKQLVSAVGYLHQRNKIHRDLKPSNILFAEDGRLKICDLGLVADRAIRNGQEFDRTRTVAGTMTYMAPEQRGEKYSSKVDIFSLGLLFTELCIHMTFEKKDEVFMNYQRGRPNTILNHLPAVARFASWLANVDPTRRPNCDEILSHEFLQHNSPTPIGSKPAPPPTVPGFLALNDLGKMTKPLVCIQIENGSFLLFDDTKPFSLTKGSIKADLSILDGELNCSYRGTLGKYSFFTTALGRNFKFFRAKFDENTIKFDKIREINVSVISIFNNQPYYYVELSNEWSIYHYHENFTKKDGEKFDVSEINHLSKYEPIYHKGIVYLFREQPTLTVKRMNKTIAIIEGPLLDHTSFFTSPNSDYIFILNSVRNVLLIVNTTNLKVSKLNYAPPANSTKHSIIGYHNGVLALAFDGAWGRQLMNAKLS